MKYEGIKVNSEFMEFYDSLEKLNEAFTYTEDEILSDEEVKELEAKLAELKPLYDKAKKDMNTKQAEFKAAGISYRDYDRDPEYKKIEDTRWNLFRMINPLQKKLDRHNDIIKYKNATEDQLATEEDWDRIIGYEWDVEVEDLEIDVYRDEDEYPSGWDSMRDSIIYTTVPGQSGTIDHWTVSVEVTKEWVADFLDKKVEEVTTKDLMDFDDKGFTEYLSQLDEVIDKAIESAKENYDYDDVEWYDDEPDYDPYN